MLVGVLALQGAFIEHMRMFRKLGIGVREIRLPADLNDIAGLVIPGGESTTMMNLLQAFDLAEPVTRFACAGRPVWGICAGMVCLAKSVSNPDGSQMETLKIMDITVERNAFGPQVDSFETQLNISILRDIPFPGIFIRAPYISQTGKGVKILAKLPDDRIVAAEQDNLLVTSFHPELTDDPRLHQYFARKIGL